jgi:hypothetical protein
MANKVISDPSALGWEFDPDTGRWTWGGGGSSSGGGGTGGIGEAPIDGTQYGRQDAGWTPITGGGGGGTDYEYWRLQADGGAAYNVTSKEAISFEGTGGITVTRSGSYMTIDGSGVSGGGGGGNYDNYVYWRYEVDGTDTTSVMTMNTVNFRAGANVTLTKTPDGIEIAAAGGSGSGGGGGNDPRITDTQISNWDDAYGWGNHASQGYLTSSSLAPYATQQWVGTNYQPKGNYLTSFTESDPVFKASPAGTITQTMINNWNNPPAGGSWDGKFTGAYASFTCTDTTGALRIDAPNCGIKMSGAGNTGKYIRLNGDKIEFLKGNYTGVLLSIDDDGLVKTNNNFGGTSFSSTVNGEPLMTMYGNAIANAGTLGAGLYFSKTAQSPTITPCRGEDFGPTDNILSLGNPSRRFFKIWSVNGVAATRRHTQNDGEAVLSISDLIEAFESLREATKEEKTMEGLRDSIGNCVGGIVERLEAIQAATSKQTAQEMEMYAADEDEPMPPFTLTPELPPVE